MTAARVRVAAGLGAAVDDVRTALGLFGVRAWLVVIAGAGAAAVLLGVPTDLIDTPLFVRMIPARAQDYALWAGTVALSGLIAGTFALPAPDGGEGKTLAGGALSYFAVGCPICNKLVVLLLGTSSALTFFAPLQLYLGLGSVVLLAWTLRLRARVAVGACALPPPPQAPERAPEPPRG